MLAKREAQLIVVQQLLPRAIVDFPNPRVARLKRRMSPASPVAAIVVTRRGKARLMPVARIAEISSIYIYIYTRETNIAFVL